MARNNDRDRERAPKRTPRDTRPNAKRKVCVFCRDSVTWVDYKDLGVLKRFVNDRGRIRPSRISGNCTQHQRDVQIAVKTARELALLPYSQRTVSERAPGSAPSGSQPGGTATQVRRSLELPEELVEDEASSTTYNDEEE